MNTMSYLWNNEMYLYKYTIKYYYYKDKWESGHGNILINNYI